MFKGRLFGPGLAGSGINASGQWLGGELQLTLADGAGSLRASQPQLTAAGFNRERWQITWTDVEGGQFAFFVESPADQQALTQTAPPTFAASLRAAQQVQAGLKRRWRWAWSALAALALLPLIGLVALVLHLDDIAGWAVARIPPEHEARLGDLMLTSLRRSMSLQDSGAAVQAVRTIGEKLTPGTRHKYRWFVADQPEINAFAAPGGIVVVNAGLLRQAASAEEVAGVLAHEVAHAELRHGLQGMVKSLGIRAVMAIVAGDWADTLWAEGAQTLGERHFTRDAEREADAEGLRRLIAANIPAGGMVTFFEKLAKAEGGKSNLPALLSTHPATEERLQFMRRELAARPPQGIPLAIDWTVVIAALPAAKTDKPR
jgi:beta-barrel assembly-enhancing protease